MVGPNKILTVSYGTFSCTLEGFDDPFGAMRGIAEYFRDLAADDRYFGAEPPTPDAEMLHRIAEQEIQRRVEARVSPDGIVLRQSPEAAPALRKAEPEEETEAAEHAGAESDWFSPEPSTGGTGASVAERLARIRAVVEQHDDDDAEEEDDGAYADDLEEAFAEADTTESDADLSEDFETTASGDETEGETGMVEAAEEDSTVHPGETAEAHGDAAMDFDAEAFAEQFAASDEDADEFEEEEAEDAEVDLASLMLSPQVEDDEDDENHEELPAADEAPEPVAGPSDFARLIAAESATAEAETQIEPQDEATVARLLRMRRSDFEATARATAYVDEVAEAPFEAVAEDVTAAPETEFAEIADVEAEEEDVTAAEFEVVETDALPETTEDEDEDFDLPLDAGDHEHTAARPISRPEQLQAEKTSVRRLLDVTNTEMGESEGSRRRSAIAHLKAAVAATRADRRAAAEEGQPQPEADDDDTDMYRDDLARVVRPRRLDDAARAQQRRLPPLMLVSEQRIDNERPDDAQDDDPAGNAAIRPRRIRSQMIDQEDEDDDADDNIFSEAGSFSEFASEMGASDLPDLLEAAAAYYHYVEGQQHFSRPQIMNAVASMEGEDFSREEGLRSFGMLLRRGKIHKIRRGQFEIDDSTRFRPQLRAGE